MSRQEIIRGVAKGFRAALLSPFTSMPTLSRRTCQELCEAASWLMMWSLIVWAYVLIAVFPVLQLGQLR